MAPPTMPENEKSSWARRLEGAKPTEVRAMNIKRRGALIGLVLTFAAGLARGQAPAVPVLSAEDQRTVADVVKYLQSLTNASGRFVQTNARGGQADGVFYLQRPGRARFDYDPPSGLVIASDGRSVSVVDHRLKTIHVYPINATPLGLFLARDIRLDRGVVVTKLARSQGNFSLVAQDGRKASRAHIALTFSETPLALTGWTLTDQRGGVVTVRLEGFKRSEPHDPGFFKLSDPRSTADLDPSPRER